MVTRVLIADDDPRITEIHQHYVSKFEGFEVIGLSNTLEDTKLQIEVMEPQLLLLDIYFPDGSGIELLKEIRLRSQALDIIPITAAKEVRLLQEALRGGVFDYILKPVVFSRFEQTLRRYRTRHSNLQSLDSLNQSDIDRIIHQEKPTDSSRMDSGLPKGIDPVTLDKILEEMKEGSTLFTFRGNGRASWSESYDCTTLSGIPSKPRQCGGRCELRWRGATRADLSHDSLKGRAWGTSRCMEKKIRIFCSVS